MTKRISLAVAAWMSGAALALSAFAAPPTDLPPFEQLSANVIQALKAGAHADAERMARQAFTIAETFDAHDPRRVNIRVLRGEVERNAGKSAEAEAWYRAAVATAENVFGEFAPELITPLEALANLYTLSKRPEQAVPIDARLLALAEHARPPEPMEIARRCRLLAEAHVRARQPAAAKRYFQRAVEIADTFPPAWQADTAEYHRAFADYLLRQSQVSHARTEAERGLSLAEKSLGPDDLGVCAPLETCGDVRLAAKEPDAAAEYYERSVRILEHVAGTGSADLARPLVRLAAAERARGRLQQAEALCDRASTVVIQGLGPNAPELYPVLEEKAALSDDRRNPAAAKVLRQRAEELRKHSAG